MEQLRSALQLQQLLTEQAQGDQATELAKVNIFLYKLSNTLTCLIHNSGIKLNGTKVLKSAYA